MSKLRLKLAVFVVLLAGAHVHAAPCKDKDALVTGRVKAIERDGIVVTVGADDVRLPKTEQLPKDRYRINDVVLAHCMPSGDLSRTTPHFVGLLFTREVPEVAKGIVKIEGAAREAGVRTKISFSSSDANVDPIGAVVGERGGRVRPIVAELRGEPIDMVPYSATPSRYVSDALAPADVKRIIIDETSHRMEIVVPDKNREIAIGKNGINLWLAAQLTGWKIDLHLESKFAAAEAAAKRKLAAVVKTAGLPKTLTEKAFARGWRTPTDLSIAKPDELVKELGLDDDAAKKLIAAAVAAVAKQPAKP